jgi:hypothetical protein
MPGIGCAGAETLRQLIQANLTTPYEVLKTIDPGQLWIEAGTIYLPPASRTERVLRGERHEKHTRVSWRQ